MNFIVNIFVNYFHEQETCLLGWPASFLRQSRRERRFTYSATCLQVWFLPIVISYFIFSFFVFHIQIAGKKSPNCLAFRKSVSGRFCKCFVSCISAVLAVVCFLWYMLDVDLCWCNMYVDDYQCISNAHIFVCVHVLQACACFRWTVISEDKYKI